MGWNENVGARPRTRKWDREWELVRELETEPERRYKPMRVEKCPRMWGWSFQRGGGAEARATWGWGRERGAGPRE